MNLFIFHRNPICDQDYTCRCVSQTTTSSCLKRSRHIFDMVESQGTNIFYTTLLASVAVHITLFFVQMFRLYSSVGFVGFVPML